jgi:voltage-gated potassium channel
MAALATRPIASDFLDLVTHNGAVDYSLYELTIPDGSPLIGKTIGDVDIREKSGALVLAIKKNDGSFDLQPKPATTIRKSDVLVVIGTQEQYDSLEKMV